MGLSGYLHWIAWFIKCFVFLLIPMSIITIMLTVEFGGNGKILNKSDPSLVFIYLVLYAISSIMYGFMISTFFSRANVAAAGGGITWFLSYIPYFFLAMYYNLLNTPQKTASCLDFNVAMAFGASLIGNFEGQGTGVQWSTLMKGVTVDDDFAFGTVLLMMVVDSVLYGLITWYVEAVFPGEFGIPQPWYFPFKKTYWCGVRTGVSQMVFSSLTTVSFQGEYLMCKGHITIKCRSIFPSIAHKTGRGISIFQIKGTDNSEIRLLHKVLFLVHCFLTSSSGTS